MRRYPTLTSVLLTLTSFAAPGAWSQESSPAVSFRQEVMAVLSRSGCNQGACHGNLTGKGGFKLSLRGEDPDKDFAVLTHDLMSRRINRFEPDASLLLQKATTRVPHEGGQRFPVGSPEHAILLRWIAQGARADALDAIQPVKLLVEPEEDILMLSAARSNDSIDVNRADADQLQKIPGVGLALSRNIVEHRTAKGLFRTIDDLGNVRGIKAKTLEKIRPYITLSADLQVRTWAVYNDGRRKDVSGLAVFESTNPKVEVSRSGLVKQPATGEGKVHGEETTIVVRYLNLQSTSLLAYVPARPGYQWSNPQGRNYVDDLVFARLQKLRIDPSDLCGDHEFLRRAHLDLLGILPTAKETRQFLADTHADKRARLIDSLLERPEFAEFWALKWSDLLRNEEKQLDRRGVKVFYEWIRKSIAGNKPLNEFARELIASRGSTYAEPAANYYRALRDPNSRAEATAQVFLGVRMQCAKCHNHPFNRWTQNDYHQLAAFFPRVQYKLIDNKRKDKLDSHEFIGEQVVYFDDKSEVKHPYTGEVMKPRLLGTQTLELAAKDDRLLLLADWIARPDNPFFARAQANRIWAYLMGQGLVDPTDDFRQTNPAANGPLLEALTKDFRDHKFDLKHLIRTIMNSRTYQASAKPNDTNAEDETNCSHVLIRSLPAESLLDAIAQVTQTTMSFAGFPDVKRAGQLPSLPQLRRGESLEGSFRFLRTFGKPERLLNCDCERSDSTTLAQALQLITGDLVNKAIANPDNCLGTMLKEGKSNAEIIDELFLASLCRPPTAAERTGLIRRLELAADRREALEDVLWGLLNSKEFLLRK